jgi:hypothetical protein
LKSLAAVYSAVCNWRTVALSTDMGLLETELDDFAPAFEHPDMKVAQSLPGDALLIDSRKALISAGLLDVSKAGVRVEYDSIETKIAM